VTVFLGVAASTDDHHRTAMLSFAWIIAAGSAGSNSTLNATEY
jgi:hypothetical protein